ncbi:hypothetical protein MBLNU230_g4317t1 [Neophaeotheca triangularis]
MEGNKVHNTTQSRAESPDFVSTEADRSRQFTAYEHGLSFWHAVRLYWPAVAWTLFINLAVVLKGVDGNVVGSLVGLQPFKETFGYKYRGEYLIPAQWLGAFNYANNIGAVVGSLLAGAAYDRFGPRKVIAVCSALSMGVIFIQFFANTPTQLFTGELINGIIIAFYPIVASTFVGEVCPLALRGFAASMTNLAFVIGQFIAAGILKGTNKYNNNLAYKIPLATQWILPAILLAIIYFCPDPPYWLCRRGKPEAARHSLTRLTTSNIDVDIKLAHVKETLALETSYAQGPPRFKDCFRGTNFRRLVICIMAYDMQAFTGNLLFISYAVYFFETAGLDGSNSFSLNLGLKALGFIGTVLSWFLMTRIGRRTAYLMGCTSLMMLLFLIGVLDTVKENSNNTAATWAQCVLMMLCNIVYDTTVGPFCYVLLAEVSAVHLRGLSVSIATVTVQISSIVFSVSIPYAMQEDEGNWGGKLGFLFAGLSMLCTLYCWFFLPETKDRTFEELDIMFERRIRSRKFQNYDVDAPEEVRRQLRST